MSVFMSDLGPAVKQLVLLATKGAKDWEKRQAAHEVIKAFNPKDEKATASALKALGAGIKEASGSAEQLLLLVVGALVEAGASPELAWPTVAPSLKDTLTLAARYGDLCVDYADDPGIPEAVKYAGDTLKKKYRAEWEAWDMLSSRCITAVACLARSSKLREKARASKDDLIKAAGYLDDLVEPVTFFNHVLKLIDDVPLLVLHPDTRRGWRMVMNDVTTNLEMFVLLLDALIGDPKKGMLPGARPNERAVRILKDPDYDPKTAPEIKVHWNLMGWTGVLPDKTLIDPQADGHAEWVWLEGVPIEIPIFEGERVVMFQPPVMKRDYEVEGPFHALRPRLEMKSKVSAAEVDRLLGRMAIASAPIRAKRQAAEEAAMRAARKAIAEAERKPKKRSKR